MTCRGRPDATSRQKDQKTEGEEGGPLPDVVYEALSHRSFLFHAAPSVIRDPLTEIFAESSHQQEERGANTTQNAPSGIEEEEGESVIGI